MELFDLHCDTLCEGLKTDYSFQKNGGAIDLDRGSVYRPWYQTFAAWIPDGLPVNKARSRCEALLNVVDRWASESLFAVIRTARDLMMPPAACCALLAVENGGALSADAAYLRMLHSRGVRLITLTWNGDNFWGGGCLGTADLGLTESGKSALEILERLDITVDVSHLGDAGFWQVEALAKKPYIASHSASFSVHPHPRNLTDDQFIAIRDRGGVVGLSLYPEHLGGSTIESICRHLEHFVALGGEKTVCIGADFDGMTAPTDWNGIAVMKRIQQHLIHRGWNRAQVEAVLFTNARDFFLRRWSQTIRNEE